jgi:hypothetical protein
MAPFRDSTPAARNASAASVHSDSERVPLHATQACVIGVHHLAVDLVENIWVPRA